MVSFFINLFSKTNKDSVINEPDANPPTSKVCIRNAKGEIIHDFKYEGKESRKELIKFIKEYSASTYTYGISSSFIIGKNTLLDTLFPTLINGALKVDNSAKKALASLGAFIWDIVTLPVRILTAIVWLPYKYFNKAAAEHILMKYLIEKGVEAERLTDTVTISVEFTSSVIHKLADRCSDPEKGELYPWSMNVIKETYSKEVAIRPTIAFSLKETADIEMSRYLLDKDHHEIFQDSNKTALSTEALIKTWISA